MQSLIQTIISQYGNSPILQGLLNDWNANLDPSESIQDFLDNIWDVSTAVGYGLDVWGKIVGVSRNLQIPTGTYFGFQDGTSDYQPFGQAPFYTGTPQTGTVALSDTAYRQLILLKAMANISNSSVQSYNQLLQAMFGSQGRCYCIDQGGMILRFVFEFFLPAYMLAILQQSGAVPRPAGVQLFGLQVDVAGTFGFAGSGMQPFGQGAFGQPLFSINS